MYPLEEGLLFPRRQWWIAAWSEEVGETPMQRTLLDEDVLLYRTSSGDVTAMAAHCVHRLFPLVKGERSGDRIVCGYHGFEFDPTGRCVHIPTQDRVPEAMRLRHYPTQERYGWVWIWMGEPEQADPAAIPAPPCMNEPDWEWMPNGKMTVACRYTLLLDNLFDLSHVAFVHVSLLSPDGSKPAGFEINPELCAERGAELTAVRRVAGIDYDGYASLLYGPGEGKLDLQVPTDYYGPALLVTGAIHWLRPGGRPGPHMVRMADGRMGGSLRNVHGVTPETRHTTHYFNANVRNVQRGNAEFTALYNRIDQGVRAQDDELLVQIEARLRRGDVQLKDEQSALQDAGGIRARRLLQAQIRAEQV